MARPDLNDPEQRMAYRRELLRVHRGWRWVGLAFVTAGVAVILVNGNGFDRLSIALLIVGWAILAGVIVARTRYHRRRMRES
jgi:drug/metabolite transporter (DMT)-like permease